jgi:hypothetical protein
MGTTKQPVGGSTVSTHVRRAGGPILVKRDRGDGWLAVYAVSVQDEEPVVASFHVVPKPDSMKGWNDLHKRLGTEVVSAPPGGLTERYIPGVTAALAEAAIAVRELSSGYLRDLSEVERQDLDAYRRGGGPGHDDFFYARLAAAYVDASERSRSPVADVAAELGYRREYVRDILHRARARGFLTPPAPGRRSGGELTDKAVTTLARGEGES